MNASIATEKSATVSIVPAFATVPALIVTSSDLHDSLDLLGRFIVAASCPCGIPCPGLTTCRAKAVRCTGTLKMPATKKMSKAFKFKATLSAVNYLTWCREQLLGPNLQPFDDEQVIFNALIAFVNLWESSIYGIFLLFVTFSWSF